jgi:hypothetical protein
MQIARYRDEQGKGISARIPNAKSEGDSFIAHVVKRDTTVSCNTRHSASGISGRLGNIHSVK